MLSSILLFVTPCWIINSMLNMLYPLRNQFTFIRKMDAPIDRRSMLGRTRLLGDSTTILGFFVAILLGLIIQIIFPFIPGVLMGLGMYIGHAGGSFIKRRLGYRGGEFLPVVDHGDGIIVTGLLLYMCGYITISVYLISIAISLIVYPIVCYSAYTLKIRERPL